MAVQNGDQFVIVDVAEASTEMRVTQKTEVREQLAEPNVGPKPCDAAQPRPTPRGISRTSWQKVSLFWAGRRAANATLEAPGRGGRRYQAPGRASPGVIRGTNASVRPFVSHGRDPGRSSAEMPNLPSKLTGMGPIYRWISVPRTHVLGLLSAALPGLFAVASTHQPSCPPTGTVGSLPSSTQTQPYCVLLGAGFC